MALKINVKKCSFVDLLSPRTLYCIYIILHNSNMTSNWANDNPAQLQVDNAVEGMRATIRQVEDTISINTAKSSTVNPNQNYQFQKKWWDKYDLKRLSIMILGGILALSLIITVIVVTTGEKELKAGDYEKCELAAELLGYGDPYNQSTISEWLCLTYHESEWAKSLKRGPDDNKSYDWGLFQINDLYWCKDKTNTEELNDYDECDIECPLLLDNDLQDDAKCAGMIYDRHGFAAWYAWSEKCRALTDLEKFKIDDCDFEN